MKAISQADYQSLAEFRHQIRSFLHFSERAARAAGLEPRQHQMLLGIKGLPSEMSPRVATLAERLKIQHHSAVELADRLAKAGLIQRKHGKIDRREALLSLTAKGERILRKLAVHHLAELRTAGPALLAALDSVVQDSHGASRK